MHTSKIIFPVFLFLVLFTSAGISQPEYPFYRKADHQFDLGQYQDAETAYRKANEIKSNPEVAYNLGNAVYEQNRMPEAVTQYQKVIDNSNDPELKSNAYYNMGNAHFQNKEYDEAIKNYKESLKLKPTDEEAKKNLMLAMRQLQQQQQQQQQKDQQKKDENKDQQKQDQQQQPSEQDKKDQQQQQSQEKSQQDQQQQESKEDISKEEAKEILKAVEREDQRVQEKLKKMPGSKAPPVKDW